MEKKRHEKCTTETENIALSEVAKKIKFIIQLMSTMNMNVEVPITIYFDDMWVQYGCQITEQPVEGQSMYT